MAVAVATGQEAGHKPVEVPTELIISHLIPQLSPDGLLALSQTSRYFRACAKSAPPHTAGVPPLHPYHQAGAQLLKVSNKWTCIHYAIARQDSARGRQVGYGLVQQSSFSLQGGTLAVRTARNMLTVSCAADSCPAGLTWPQHTPLMLGSMLHASDAQAG